MIRVQVDGVEVSVQRGATVLQACEALGIEIPRFCYHEKLSIAGNCRMCLVEIFKTPKPVASCAMPTMEGMQIFTQTPLVKKAREAVLEFLLLNHPLDCPICDQGGECDLQDQALAFGTDRSRFFEPKRGVENKNCGPLIKTIMTRCIHCTRCVRFATEWAGVEDLGTTGRGRETEIGTYIEKTFQSELSGNVIDLCPVGALTSKPYAFLARPWEVLSTESLDLSDAWGAPLRVDSRGREVLRILPRPSREGLQEEWISDKARFAFDGLKTQRLDRPYLRRGGTFQPLSWEGALRLVAGLVTRTSSKGQTFGARLGQAQDTESCAGLWALSRWAQGSTLLRGEQPLGGADPGLLSSFSSTFFGQEGGRPVDTLRRAESCLLLGVDPRYEAPMVNLLLREGVLHRNLSVGVIGSPVDLTFPLRHLGHSLASLGRLAEGKDPFVQTLSSGPALVLVGSQVLASPEGPQVASLLGDLREKGLEVHLLPGGANQVGQIDLLGLETGPLPPLEVLYLLGADEEGVSLSAPASGRGPGTFTIYQGTHGDRNAQAADLILPGAAFTEKEGTYLDGCGSVGRTQTLMASPGAGRSEATFLETLGMLLQTEALLGTEGPWSLSGEWSPATWSFTFGSGPRDRTASPVTPCFLSGPASLSSRPLGKRVVDFYQTDSLTRASRTMRACSRDFQERASNFLEKG